MCKGWLTTFEGYYSEATKHILNNLVEKLTLDPRRKFIWAEISFFSMWWNEQTMDTKDKVRALTRSGQLEFVTGGWVMNDEANCDYFAILEQLIIGHEWLQLNLNYNPKYAALTKFSTRIT